MKYESEIWGPHFWFFLHTIAYNYPVTPNEVVKRKYYDLIMNMPLFIPDVEIGKKFSALLDKYPVTPYLGNNKDFQKWMHFIHNYINKNIGKPQISRREAYEIYKEKYANKTTLKTYMVHLKKHYVYLFYIFVGILTIYMIKL